MKVDPTVYLEEQLRVSLHTCTRMLGFFCGARNVKGAALAIAAMRRITGTDLNLEARTSDQESFLREAQAEALIRLEEPLPPSIAAQSALNGGIGLQDAMTSLLRGLGLYARLIEYWEAWGEKRSAIEELFNVRIVTQKIEEPTTTFEELGVNVELDHNNSE